MTGEPRIAAWVRRLPDYRRAVRRWDRQPDVAAPLAYLGVKLSDADFYREALRSLAAAAEPSIADYSRAADAWVFAAYGALDALAQVVVRVAGIETDEEVKFPALTRLLAGAAPPVDRWDGLRSCLTEVYEAEWSRRRAAGRRPA